MKVIHPHAATACKCPCQEARYWNYLPNLMCGLQQSLSYFLVEDFSSCPYQNISDSNLQALLQYGVTLWSSSDHVVVLAKTPTFHLVKNRNNNLYKNTSGYVYPYKKYESENVVTRKHAKQLRGTTTEKYSTPQSNGEVTYYR